MALAWILIVLPLHAGDARLEVPYSFLDKQSCTEIGQWLYPDRQYRCVVRPLENQFASLEPRVE